MKLWLYRIKVYYCGLLIRLSWFESKWSRFCWFIQHGVLWHTEIHRNLFCNWNCEGVGCLIASVAQLVDCAWLVIMILRNTSVRIRALALWLGGAIGRRGRLKSDFSEGSIPSWATKVGYVFCYFYLQTFNLCIKFTNTVSNLQYNINFSERYKFRRLRFLSLEYLPVAQ